LEQQMRSCGRFHEGAVRHQDFVQIHVSLVKRFRLLLSYAL
jgi:hypothetical protein